MLTSASAEFILCSYCKGSGIVTVVGCAGRWHFTNCPTCHGSKKLMRCETSSAVNTAEYVHVERKKVIPGETIASGAPDQCPDCGTKFVDQVLKSAAGYYVGTCCPCGPNSRESEYFDDREMAEKALASDAYGR